MDQEQASAFFVVRALMAVIAFTLGLGLAAADFARVLAARRAVAVGMSAQTLLMPSLGFAVAFIYDLEAPLAIGLVLLAACPGGVHSNYYTRLARGDVALSVTLTSLSTLVNMATLPLWVYAAMRAFGRDGETVTMSAGEAIAELLLLIALPLVAGMALRARRQSLATRIERGMMLVTGSLLILIIAGSVLKQAGLMASHALRVGLPVLSLQALTMSLAYALAKAADLPIAQRLTIALEGGIQNATLAFALSLALASDLTVAIPAIVYSVAIYFTAALVIPIGRAVIPASS